MNASTEATFKNAFYAVALHIRAAGRASSGECYAVAMGHGATLDQYEVIEATLVDGKAVKKGPQRSLTWLL